MTPEDYHGVYELWSNTPGVGINDIDDSYDGILKYLIRNPSSCFVAEETGEIIGVIMSGHDGRRGFIYHTAVRLDCRGKGVGTALVNAAIEALRNEGIIKVALVVFYTNENGNTFWEKLGFIRRDDLVYRNTNISS